MFSIKQKTIWCLKLVSNRNRWYGAGCKCFENVYCKGYFNVCPSGLRDVPGFTFWAITKKKGERSLLEGLFLSLSHQATFGMNGDVIMMSWGARRSLKRHLTPVLWIPPALLNQQVSLLNSQRGISGKFQDMDRYKKSYIYPTLNVCICYETSILAVGNREKKSLTRKKRHYDPTHFYSP